MAIPIDGEGSGVTPIVDNVDDTHIPIKLAGAYENSPMHWSGVPGENIISDETIEVPAGTIQVGEGLKMSAAGVIPLFNSLLTGKTYIPAMFEYDEATGYNKPFMLDFGLPETIVVQPDFSLSTPLTGTFNNAVTVSEFIVSLGLKTNASATLTNVRLQFVSQSTGEPIYYFPSKAGWLADEGEDLVADGAGDILIDFGDAPLGLLEGEVIINNYKIDAGVLLGDGAIPYQEVTRKTATFTDVITELEFATESTSTSVIIGGDITEASPTTVNVSAGRERNTVINIDGTATVTNTTWEAFTGVAVTNILTNESTRFGIDAAGALQQLDFVLTDASIRDYAILGFVAHPDGIIARVKNDKLTSRELYSQFVDHLEVLGVTRKKGVSIGPGTGLTITKTSGILESPGGGIDSGERGQNIIPIDAATPATFTTFLGITNTKILIGTTALNPTHYDSGALTPTLIPTAVPANSTIVSLYQSIDDSATGLFYKYGETIYATLDAAILNAPTDTASIPVEIETRANLVARIAMRRDLLDMATEPDKFEILSGVKFGAGVDGLSLGTVSGGGDYFGPAASIADEIHTFADVSGKSGKSGSDIIAASGSISRSTPNADLTLSPNGTGSVVAGTSSFKDGDSLQYPTADGLAGDSVKTDGAGALTIAPDNYTTFTTSATLEYDDKLAYIKPIADITLTLADNPRLGERKRLWVADNIFVIDLVSANPSFPLAPPPLIAEANIQGLWTLNSDFLDRYTVTGRDLTNSGTGGIFEAVTVNGNAVQALNFQQTAYLEAVASSYKGVTGSAPRSFTCWYGANAGIPIVDETIVAWGEDIPTGGFLWEIDFRASGQYLWVNNRNASRRWNFTTLDAVGLFDGNMHHIAVTQSTANMNSVNLYIDGVRVVHDFQDTFPNNATTSVTNFRIGANYSGGTPLNGKLYDCRLYNKGLTLTEVTQTRDDNILGGVNLAGADNDMVFDVSFNGTEWVLGTGTEVLALTNKGEIESLQASVMLGAGSSVGNELVTFADETGQQAGNTSGITVIGGVFNRVAPDTNISLEANTGGFVLLISPDGFVGIEPGGAFLSYGSANVAVRPTGAIECTSTTGAFFPPSMTTAQRLALPLTEGSHVRDTDLGLSIVLVNGLWQSYGALTVAGRTAEQSGIALLGTLQPITTGSFHYYQIAGVDSTPTLAGGVWTVDVTGKYQLNLSGWPVSGGAVESQVIFYVSVNGSDYVANPNVGIAAVGINGDGIAMGGQIDLSTGDNVNIAYSVISGTGWVLDRFHWDIARLS